MPIPSLLGLRPHTPLSLSLSLNTIVSYVEDEKLLTKRATVAPCYLIIVAVEIAQNITNLKREQKTVIATFTVNNNSYYVQWAAVLYNAVQYKSWIVHFMPVPLKIIYRKFKDVLKNNDLRQKW